MNLKKYIFILALLGVSLFAAAARNAGNGRVAGMEPSSAEEYRPARYAVVNLSVNFLREAPDYTAELGTQALMGTIVEILDETGYWRKVRTPDPYTAWCTSAGLMEMSAEQIALYRTAPKYICTAWHSTVYSEPSCTSQKICDIVEGDILRMVCKGKKATMKKSGEMMGARLPSEEEVISAKPVLTKGYAKVQLPDGRTGYVPKNDIEHLAEWENSRCPSPDNIIAEAMKYVGVPYLWGGTSPNGVDCSGLTSRVFCMNGIRLPRNASQQALEGKDIPIDDINNFRRGDLLFFGTRREDGSPRITHVGIYIGGGKFIHSSHYVRINSLDPSAPDYYENSPRLLRCRRVIPK